MENSYKSSNIEKLGKKPSSRKRTTLFNCVEPCRKKVRDDDGGGNKPKDLQQNAKKSSSARVNHVDSKSQKEPLQEPKVKRSEPCHAAEERGDSESDTLAQIGDPEPDFPHLPCENSFDMNKNMTAASRGGPDDSDPPSSYFLTSEAERSETRNENVKARSQEKTKITEVNSKKANGSVKVEDDEAPIQLSKTTCKNVKQTKEHSDDIEAGSGESKTKIINEDKIAGKNKKRRNDEKEKTGKKRKKDVTVSSGSKKENRGRGDSSKKKDDMKDETDKWKWWEEGQSQDGKKWKTLEHKGPLFPPEYEPLPENVSFYYDGKAVPLSQATEEVATFYAKMLDHEYTSKEIFQKNFFSDWRKEMTAEEKEVIQNLSKCDFKDIHKYFLEQSEKKKSMTKEEKEALKKEANRLTEEYGYCILDGHREKIGNFRVEPPGLFRGRGEHPKMGKLKKRVLPEDITINCGKDSKVPQPPKGHKWKRVQHDSTVTWLASWVENIQGSIKYVMLNPSSKLKGEKDWQKYEIARKLKLKVDDIRNEYKKDWRSREMKKRQRGVAIYFIDKLALRAGNEKEEGETADTVGCCSLRVEHITLHDETDGQQCVVEFDFLGKDSIRYYNKVPVEKQVFKNLRLFMENKDPEDDLFDRINTMYLNKTLNNSMQGLTAKVFRTFNASTTLQDQLNKLTSSDMSVEEKILSYNRANRAVAILCNHQRTAPKSFEKSMQNLQEKIELKEKQLEEAREELRKAKRQYKENKTDKLKKLVEQKENAVKRLEEQLKKLRLQMTDREENKVIALGTSKLNYLDPRISVAWCKKFGVPVEKIYNKTQRDKFAWAIDMTDEHFQF